MSEQPSQRAPQPFFGPACDCHSHIYGPFARFPLPRDHPPVPERTLEDYAALAARLGVERSVFVQPLAYGLDHEAMLDAIARKGPSLARGVAILRPDVKPALLRRLDDGGVRGARIMTTEPGAAGLDDLARMARLVAPLGWHLLCQGDGRQIPLWEKALRGAPAPVVIDHVGRLPPGDGTNHPAFKALLGLLERGEIWVKLSAFYYGFGPTGDDREIADRVRALVAARPDRLVWGLNWPHPRFADGEKPDDEALLRRFISWLPGEAAIRAIMCENPARLYGFA